MIKSNINKYPQLIRVISFISFLILIYTAIEILAITINRPEERGIFFVFIALISGTLSFCAFMFMEFSIKLDISVSAINRYILSIIKIASFALLLLIVFNLKELFSFNLPLDTTILSLLIMLACGILIYFLIKKKYSHIIKDELEIDKLIIKAEISKLKNNQQEALQFYKLASNKGSIEARLDMGFMLLEGEGCIQDEATGLYHIIEAISKLRDRSTKAISYLHLFMVYYNKSNPNSDEERAVEYLIKAGAYYDDYANRMLAYLSYTGENGFKQDQEAAIQYLIKSKYNLLSFLYNIHKFLAHNLNFFRDKLVKELEFMKRISSSEKNMVLADQMLYDKTFKSIEKGKLEILEEKLAQLENFNTIK